MPSSAFGVCWLSSRPFSFSALTPERVGTGWAVVWAVVLVAAVNLLMVWVGGATGIWEIYERGWPIELLATSGTAEFLAASGLGVRRVHKVHEERPHIVDHLINRDVDLVINTPLGRESHEDDALIRRTALKHDIPCITTLSGALAAAEGISALREEGLEVASLQEISKGTRATARPSA